MLFSVDWPAELRCKQLPQVVEWLRAAMALVAAYL